MKKFNIANLDNDYELVNLLGEEIIDKVYLGKNKIDQSLEVIKLIDLKELDEQAITFLSEEGNTLIKLMHPNITNFHDFEIVNGQAYIIMDYADNGRYYEGDWVENNKHGKGKERLENGNVYDGDFVTNVMEGKGKMYYKNKDVYTGDFH